MGDWGNNWIPCGDGKARRIEPGLAPLAHAVSGRVAAMRPDGNLHWYNRTGASKGFGNAIVPGVAAEFIKAYMETT
jgi:DNA (cytosine-5)-methyltransferase 1